MMLQSSASRNTSLRYLGVLPLLGLMVVLFACQPERSQSNEIISEAEQNLPATEVEQNRSRVEGEDTPPIEAYTSADQEPKPINLNELRKEIGYPQIARDAKIDGMLVARILIDEKGEYLKHEIIKEAHAILNRAVEKELPKIQMTPALKDGVPVKYWVNIPFNFKLID